MTPDDRELATKIIYNGEPHGCDAHLQRVARTARTLITAELAAKAVPNGFRIVLHKNLSGAYEFVEVEDVDGNSFDAGPWIKRPAGYTEIQADQTFATLTAQAEALRAENERLRGLLSKVFAACDEGRMIEKGAGGMTIDAQLRRSVYVGVPVWPIEEARAALAQSGGE